MLFQHLAGALWPNIFQHLQHASPGRLQYIVNICLIVVLPLMHEKIRMTKSATSVIGQAVVAPHSSQPIMSADTEGGLAVCQLIKMHARGQISLEQYIPTLSEGFV